MQRGALDNPFISFIGIVFVNTFFLLSLFKKMLLCIGNWKHELMGHCK